MDEKPEYEGRELEVLANLSNYNTWIVDHFKPYLHGHCIEFGAGTGTFSALLSPHLEHLVLVEPSPNLTAELRQRFKEEKGIIIVEDSLEAHAAAIKDASVDTIVLINVLEHIADDKHVLNEFFRILKPGGHLLLFVPALSFLFSEIDRIFQHHRRYNLSDLNLAVKDSGFNIVDSRYFDFLGTFPWWLAYTVGGSKEFNPRLSKIYDRFAVPVSRVIERLVRPLFGKNIAMIARHDQEG